MQDTWVLDTATTCAYSKGGAIGTVFERVRAENCGGLGLVLGFDTSPEFFDLQANPEYYESIGGVIRNCIVSDTALAGIAIYAAGAAHVLNNTVMRAGQDGHAGLYFGITLQDNDLGAGRPASRNPVVIGNIIDQSGLPGAACAGIRYTVEDDVGVVNALEGPVTLRDNLYWGEGGVCTFDDTRPDSLLEAGDLAAWQAHIAGYDDGSVMANPLLDESGHLTDGSPAIDALGENPGVTYDVDRVQRSAPFDLGADER